VTLETPLVTKEGILQSEEQPIEENVTIKKKECLGLFKFLCARLRCSLLDLKKLK
jgi:hypothetical protein